MWNYKVNIKSFLGTGLLRGAFKYYIGRSFSYPLFEVHYRSPGGTVRKFERNFFIIAKLHSIFLLSNSSPVKTLDIFLFGHKNWTKIWPFLKCPKTGPFFRDFSITKRGLFLHILIRLCVHMYCTLSTTDFTAKWSKFRPFFPYLVKSCAWFTSQRGDLPLPTYLPCL